LDSRDRIEARRSLPAPGIGTGLCRPACRSTIVDLMESPRSPEGEQRRSPEGEQRGAPSLVPELPANMIGRPVPEIGRPSSEGGIFRLRQRGGCGPLVLFFYIRNGTPL